MLNRNPSFHVWSLAALLGLPCAALAEPAPVKTVEYVVQKGDTCIGIAQQEFGDAKRCKQIHELNRGKAMGDSPHKLEPGSVLLLPSTVEDPDAVVTAITREVRARTTSSTGWQKAPQGTELFRGWHVNTLEKSWAELTFADTSKVQMRENTLVIIYGGAGSQIKQSQRETRLEHGTLRSRLGELAGGEVKTHKVVTPSAVASLEGGDTLIKVDDAGSSRFANHGDGTTTLRSLAGGKKVKLKKGLGSKVVRGSRPTKPKPLPKPPTWLAGADSFVGGPSGSIAGQWQSTADAASYRVEVRQSGPKGKKGKVIASVRVDKTAHSYEIHGLPAGDYEVRVATIDNDQMESLLSDARRQKVHGVEFEGPGATQKETEAQPEQGLAPSRRILPGAIMRAPEGLECRIGRGAWAKTTVASQPGLHAVECRDAAGSISKGLELEVVPVALQRGPEALAQVEPPMQVEREVVSTRRIRLDSTLELPEQLVARATPGVEVESVEKVGLREWDLTFTALPSAGQGERIDLALADGKDVPAVASVFIAVRNPPPPVDVPEPTIIESHPRFEFGGQVGAGFFAGQDLLYGLTIQSGTAQDTPTHDLPGTAVDLTVRIGYFPLKWLGVEIENRWLPTRVNGPGSAANLFGASLSAIARLPHKVSPYLGVGAAVISLDSSKDAERGRGRDTDVGPVFDAGLMVHLSDVFGVRLSVRDSMLVDGSDFLHVLSVGAGAYLRVGKRRKVIPPSKGALAAVSGSTK